jgi:hypothetical protein
MVFKSNFCFKPAVGFVSLNMMKQMIKVIDDNEEDDEEDVKMFV